MRKHAIALFAAAVLAAVPLRAEEQKKMEAPKPPAELSQLWFMSGSWTCTGTTFATPFGAEHKTESTLKGSKAVGGMWLHADYVEKKTAENASPFHAGIYGGYDAAQKKFVMGCVDNFGGYCTESSPGWEGDAMTFEGTTVVNGKRTPSRDVFTKKGTGGVTHHAEMQLEEGKWTKMDEETCKKAGK